MWTMQSDRMHFRPITLDDVTPFTAILSDPAVMQYSIHGVHDKDATRKFISQCLEFYATGTLGPSVLVEKESGDIIGFCGLFPEIVDSVEESSLGYRLARKFWNRGLATEAVKATLKRTFETSSIASVVAIIEPDHIASLRVCEKAGFEAFSNTHFHDRSVRVYRMSKSDFSAR